MLSLKEGCCSGGISDIGTQRGHILAPFRRQTVIQSLPGSATNAWDREVCHCPELSEGQAPVGAQNMERHQPCLYEAEEWVVLSVANQDFSVRREERENDRRGMRRTGGRW